jgi:DNA-binding transcriptional ArsR family regulator
MSRDADPRVALLRELSDPLRLSVVDRLGHRGPATVSELACELEVSLPQLSNHLKRLREAQLVRVTRTGRHAVYELSDPGLEVLLPLLDRITGRLAPPPPVTPMTDYRRAHTCYDHLAGRLGVALYGALLERGAVRALPDGTVELGPAAAETFASIGVDTAQIPRDRRRFAFECLDVVEHAPHLAGAVGDTIAAALADNGWIKPQSGSRTLQLGERGVKALRRTLAIDLTQRPITPARGS